MHFVLVNGEIVSKHNTKPEAERAARREKLLFLQMEDAGWIPSASDFIVTTARIRMNGSAVGATAKISYSTGAELPSVGENLAA